MTSMTLPAALAAALLGSRLAVQEMADVSVEAANVGGNVYVLTGRGGNIGLSVGADGAFLIDDQFAPLTGRILAAVGELTDRPVRFVVNTHWHPDHTGGNENLGEAGAVVVAHENVRRRMSSEQFSKVFGRRTPPAAPGALPVITFTESLTFHWNGDEVRVIHVEPAHTDGDSVIHFRQANVVHMGDTFFNGTYPYIDVDSGGSIDGVIAAADRVLALCDAGTRIIPGHGPVGGPADLRAYRAMLAAARERIAALIDRGMSRDEAVAARPTRDLDDQWGGGFMKPDVWVGIVYDSLQE